MKWHWKIKQDRRNNLYMVVTLPGFRPFEYCAQVHVDLGRWNSDLQKLVAVETPEEMLIQQKMNDLTQNACRIYMWHVLSEAELNSEDFKRLMNDEFKVKTLEVEVMDLVSDYIESSNISESRIRGIKSAAKLYVDYMSSGSGRVLMNHITADLAQKYINLLVRNQYEDTTIEQYLQTMKSLHDYGTGKQLWKSVFNPFDKVKFKVKKLPQLGVKVDIPHYPRLLNYCRSLLSVPYQVDDYTIAVTYMYAQLLLGTAYADIPLNTDGFVLIGTGGATIPSGAAFKYTRNKTSSSGIVNINFEDANFIKRCIRSLGDAPKLTEYKYKLHIRNIFKDVCQEYGLPYTDIGSHDLRKAFGTWKLYQGYSMESVSKMLAHSSIHDTEKVYAKVGIDKLIKESQELR